jgi:murein DD-endopeptidase MepM/ murein hydrolase activator NlpD
VDTEQKPRKKSWLKQLTSKYRLVLLNEESYQEVTSVSLSRFNVYILLSTLIVIFAFLVVSAVVFTPLKEYIPGYASTDVKNKLIDMKMKTDSLEKLTADQDSFLKNLQNIINGDVAIVKTDTPASILNAPKTKNPYDSIDLKSVSDDEKKLRNEMENESKFSLGLDLSLKPSSGNSELKSYYFFPPIKGYVTDEFDPRKDHFGIDIVAPENEPIMAVMDGVVIFSQWTAGTGYVIAIQHRNNLITLYKHNSVLLKKEGNFVKAGDVIAIIGNTGEQTSGPHLHFELWYNGIPLNPKDYIVFN